MMFNKYVLPLMFALSVTANTVHHAQPDDNGVDPDVPVPDDNGVDPDVPFPDDNGVDPVFPVLDDNGVDFNTTTTTTTTVTATSTPTFQPTPNYGRSQRHSSTPGLLATILVVANIIFMM